MNFFASLKEISGAMSVVATLASCASSARDNAEWGIWSYSEKSDFCQVAEVVKLYNTSGAFRDRGTGLGALLEKGEDALLTQRYRDSDEHILRYITSSSNYLAQPGCVSEFEIERSVNGVREGRKSQYRFFQDVNGHVCKRTEFSYRLGAAANNRRTSGIVTSCLDPNTDAFSFNIERAS